jgi:hypothetical protein
MLATLTKRFLLFNLPFLFISVIELAFEWNGQGSRDPDDLFSRSSTISVNLCIRFDS